MRALFIKGLMCFYCPHRVNSNPGIIIQAFKFIAGLLSIKNTPTYIRICALIYRSPVVFWLNYISNKYILPSTYIFFVVSVVNSVGFVPFTLVSILSLIIQLLCGSVPEP